jgi:antitoxin component YwqK of YwqJK toxin-antitoxin module
MLKNLFFVFSIFFFQYLNVFSQDTTGFTRFYHENGKISSEGIIRDGKPDGYWKTYNTKGILVSEGNRVNFQLDGLWKFYNDEGKLTMEINYKKGLKNGVRKTYFEKEILIENFKDDIKDGNTYYYSNDGKLIRIIPFENGLENGISKEFDKDSVIIEITEYQRGMVINRERINRKDKNGLKQGVWKTFWDNDKTKWEGVYFNDKKNGFFKTYSPEGNLLTIEKYINDELQTDVPELRKLEVRTDYYPDGKIKTVGSYNNGIAEGVRREYNRDGTIEQSYIFSKGKIIGMGIVDEKGLKQGKWTEFYENGTKKAEGSYKDNKKIGYWKFYYKNGKIEQEGEYNNKGNTEGEWKRYFENGNTLSISNFLDGLEEGPFVEYNDTGAIVAKGEFIEGEETGMWIYNINGYKIQGNYINGKRDGVWKETYPDGKTRFVGSYFDDNPNGKHTFYWDNGKIKEQGTYIVGKREGEWRKIDYDQTFVISTFYRNGREIKFDRTDLEPKIEGDE